MVSEYCQTQITQPRADKSCRVNHDIAIMRRFVRSWQVSAAWSDTLGRIIALFMPYQSWPMRVCVDTARNHCAFGLAWVLAGCLYRFRYDG